VLEAVGEVAEAAVEALDLQVVAGVRAQVLHQVRQQRGEDDDGRHQGQRLGEEQPVLEQEFGHRRALCGSSARQLPEDDLREGLDVVGPGIQRGHVA
jgi:hypothetical protein